MPRGRGWSQDEVNSLLSLVEGSGEAALLMASTSRSNEAVWREISRGLSEAGYERSVAQCRSKWKALKQAFHSEREKRRRTGHHSARLSQHYQAMKNIWKVAGQPVFGERRVTELIKLRPRKHRSALATSFSSSSEQPASSEDSIREDTAGTLQPPQLQCTKTDAESPVHGEEDAGVPPTPTTIPCTSYCFPFGSFLGRNTVPKQEGAGEKAGPGVAGVLQNIQQLLVQILRTSQQQQALLENLASETVSHLQGLSHRLVQVGATLQQLLARPQTPPGPLGHCIACVPRFEGGPEMPCFSGTLHCSTSLHTLQSGASTVPCRRLQTTMSATIADPGNSSFASQLQHKSI